MLELDAILKSEREAAAKLRKSNQELQQVKTYDYGNCVSVILLILFFKCDCKFYDIIEQFLID